MDILGALAFAMLIGAQVCAVIAVHAFDGDDGARRRQVVPGDGILASR